MKEGQVPHDTLCEGSGRRVAIVQRIPKVCPEIMREAYIAALDAAERKVQIINPYFTPTRKVRNAIKRAAERGSSGRNHDSGEVGHLFLLPMPDFILPISCVRREHTSTCLMEAFIILKS